MIGLGPGIFVIFGQKGAYAYRLGGYLGGRRGAYLYCFLLFCSGWVVVLWGWYLREA